MIGSIRLFIDSKAEIPALEIIQECTCNWKKLWDIRNSYANPEHERLKANLFAKSRKTGNLIDKRCNWDKTGPYYIASTVSHHSGSFQQNTMKSIQAAWRSWVCLWGLLLSHTFRELAQNLRVVNVATTYVWTKNGEEKFHTHAYRQ